VRPLKIGDSVVLVWRTGSTWPMAPWKRRFTTPRPCVSFLPSDLTRDLVPDETTVCKFGIGSSAMIRAPGCWRPGCESSALLSAAESQDVDSPPSRCALRKVAEMKMSIVHASARSPEGFAPVPPFFPRRRGRRLHLSALSPEGYGNGRAVQRTWVHARASQVVELPSRTTIS